MRQTNQLAEPKMHLSRPDWLRTPDGEPRGYIQPTSLKELWFHTGTICNLSCPFCLEGSRPGDDRLNKITLNDARPFIDEACTMDVERFSFTGGEPFVIRDMVRILDYALDRRPCLVLTNATDPLYKRLDELQPLKDKPHALRLRVSIDYPDEQRHDRGRGKGNFAKAWATIGEVHRRGFAVSIARQRTKGEDAAPVERAYQYYFREAGLPSDTPIVSFPDLLTPKAAARVPAITEHCMVTYHSETTRRQFMCSYSKMIVKNNGRMRVYACTLVDDDPDYDLGESLKASMNVRVMLKHHRCYSCFAQGVSCSGS